MIIGIALLVCAIFAFGLGINVMVRVDDLDGIGVLLVILTLFAPSVFLAAAGVTAIMEVSG